MNKKIITISFSVLLLVLFGILITAQIIEIIADVDPVISDKQYCSVTTEKREVWTIEKQNRITLECVDPPANKTCFDVSTPVDVPVLSYIDVDVEYCESKGEVEVVTPEETKIVAYDSMTCSTINNTHIECDSKNDGDGDGVCKKAGGETCVIYDLNGSKEWSMTVTNNQQPDKVESAIIEKTAPSLVKKI